MKKLILLFVIASGLMLTSCYKEPEKGVAKITVINQSGHYRIPNANVELTGPAGSYIYHSFTTDMNGEVIYEHDPALEVILNVHVTDPSGVYSCNGIVRITPDKITEETFTLPY